MQSLVCQTRQTFLRSRCRIAARQALKHRVVRAPLTRSAERPIPIRSSTFDYRGYELRLPLLNTAQTASVPDRVAGHDGGAF